MRRLHLVTFVSTLGAMLGGLHLAAFAAPVVRDTHHYTLLESIDSEVCFYCVNKLV